MIWYLNDLSFQDPKTIYPGCLLAGLKTATTEYAVEIHASVEKANVFACQFHPEKSSDVGLRILHIYIQTWDNPLCNHFFLQLRALTVSFTM